MMKMLNVNCPEALQNPNNSQILPLQAKILCRQLNRAGGALVPVLNCKLYNNQDWKSDQMILN